MSECYIDGEAAKLFEHSSLDRSARPSSLLSKRAASVVAGAAGIAMILSSCTAAESEQETAEPINETTYSVTYEVLPNAYQFGGAQGTGTTVTEQLGGKIEELEFNFSLDPEIIQLSPHIPAPVEGKYIDPQAIVNHWWGFDGGGDINKLVDALANNKSCGNAGCSVQYAVTKYGVIYRMMQSPTVFALHAPGGNETGIGIEIEGFGETGWFDPSSPDFNKVQFEAVVSLNAEIADDLDMSLEKSLECDNIKGIVGHHELDHCRVSGSKPDPGDAYILAITENVSDILNIPSGPAD